MQFRTRISHVKECTDKLKIDLTKDSSPVKPAPHDKTKSHSEKEKKTKKEKASSSKTKKSKEKSSTTASPVVSKFFENKVFNQLIKIDLLGNFEIQEIRRKQYI